MRFEGAGKSVELTHREAKAKRMFDALLDRGYTTVQALNRTKDLFTGLDPAFFRWLGDQPLIPISKGEKPNLIERLENLIAALNEAEVHSDIEDDNDAARALSAINTAQGIAGEILTMIDGR